MSLCLMFQPLSLLKTGGACAAHSGDYEIGARSKDIQRQQLTSVNSFIFVRITKDGEKEQLTSVTYFY